MGAKQARAWHAVTAGVAVAALLLQLVLVVSGHATLVDAEQPGLLVRLGRFVSYFTIQSNLLVAVSCLLLAADPRREDDGSRVIRLAATVGITVTGLVHVLLLRPLLDLDGIDWATDKLLHVVVPLLAVVGYALYGPRPRVELRDVRIAVAWPVVWTVWTLVIGGVTGWYPYPFLDHREDDGTVGVVVAVAGIAVLFAFLFALAYVVDRRAAPAPRASDPYRDGAAHLGTGAP